MIAGVICEYNPFHLGHQYMLEKLRRQGAETLICAMSGNFVQRGEPAIADKLSRAEMAVACGADLVLELPTPWAMSAAETFARGGVELLEMAGCTHLAFGSECGDVAALQAVTDTLLAGDFMPAVRNKLSDGVTYAVARQQAAEERIGDLANILAKPNNILAVEYLKALRETGSAMLPLTVQRIGAAHDGAAEEGVASASHIRELLRSGVEATQYMPQAAAEILHREMEAGHAPVDIKNCERAILAHLRRMDEADFAPYDGGSEGLYHRLYDAVRQARSLEELLTLSKTKRYPLSRLRRMVLSIWLGVAEVPDRIPYLRVLAANERGRAHLRMLQKSGAPVLTKPADVGRLGADAEELFREEAQRTDMFTLCQSSISAPGTDWRITPKMR